MTSDVVFFGDVFEKFVKVSTKEIGNNLLGCVRLPVYTYQCSLECTDIILQTLQHKDLMLTIENKVRGVLSSVVGDICVVSDDKKKIIYMDANILFAHSLSQVLTFD